MKEKGKRRGTRKDEGRGGKEGEQRERKARKVGGKGSKGEVSVKWFNYCL